jgi:hypothetical protein
MSLVGEYNHSLQTYIDDKGLATSIPYEHEDRESLMQALHSAVEHYNLTSYYYGISDSNVLAISTFDLSGPRTDMKFTVNSVGDRIAQTPLHVLNSSCYTTQPLSSTPVKHLNANKLLHDTHLHMQKNNIDEGYVSLAFDGSHYHSAFSTSPSDVATSPGMCRRVNDLSYGTNGHHSVMRVSADTPPTNPLQVNTTAIVIVTILLIVLIAVYYYYIKNRIVVE